MNTAPEIHGFSLPESSAPFVHRQFEKHAADHPTRIAVADGTSTLTYAELDHRADELAHSLRARGIGTGSLVGIFMGRNVALVTAVLGVLKAGAAYVPLDTTYPRDRLDKMVGQLPALSLICFNAEYRDTVPSGRELLELSLDGTSTTEAPSFAAPPEVNVKGDDLCYVVFTSGSTGVPKAVSVRHRGWHNLLTWLVLEYGLDDSSHNLVISSFGFDITQRSIMTPLFSGARLDLLPSRNFDAALADRLIAKGQVRTLHCPPSTLYLLIDRNLKRGDDHLSSLRYIFIGGEALSVGRVEKWAQTLGSDCTLLHQYGVSECTDVATSHVLHNYEGYKTGQVPVGTPVYNTTIHILDDHLRHVPRGDTGEVCISGAGVGAGYVGAVGEAVARFTTLNSAEGQVPIYRTGDLGFVSDSSELIVVGRKDSQVKIRGNRIDLGDVDHALRRSPAIRDATTVAVPNETGELDLIAYVIASDAAIDVGLIRQHLSDSVPKAMIPSRFIEAKEFPMTPNNKVDRKALADAATPQF